MFSVLSLPFMQQALLLGMVISLGAGILSPFLVLNQHGMIAHGIAHTTFTGVVIGLLLFNDPLWVAIPFAVFISLSIEYLTNNVKLHGDVSIGIVSSIAFAIGLIILNTTSSIQVSVESLLVGNIFIARSSDMWLSIIIVLLIALFIYTFYKKLLIMTYDIVYARFLNIRVHLIKYTLAVLTALLIVVGVRAIGVLLISALIIFPSAISSKLSLTFKWTIILSIILAVVSSLLGILLAHPLNTPASAMIVVVYAGLFLVSALYERVKGT